MADPLDPQPPLEMLDKLLAEKPDQVTQDFSVATRKLTTYHDALIRKLREGTARPEARQQLDRLNAVISVVYAGHYPLRKTDWESLQRARDTFADLASVVAHVV